MGQVNQVRGRATAIYTEGDTTKVIYHGTPVVSFNQDKISLDTGGWFTMTTKLRMNQAAHQFNLGYAVIQKKGLWFIHFKGEIIPYENSLMTLTR